MICKRCKKEILPEEARHCPHCGSDYCADCAQALCDCTEELGYYH